MSDLLDRAIFRFDLVSYARDWGGHEEANGEWILACPTCGKRKLCVNPTKLTWHCWVCETRDVSGKPLSGAGGVVSLVALLERIGAKQAGDKIIAAANFQPGEALTIPDSIPKASSAPKLGPAAEILPPPFWNAVSATLPYMQKRGITMEDARAFSLGWCSAGRYEGRLVFPVFEGARLVYYQARAMWEAEDRPWEKYIKSLNPAKEEGAAVSSEVLMNLDQASKYPRVCITEGPIDCVKTGPSAVCTFGKRIYPAQIAKLARAGVKAVDLMWDGPSASEPVGAWPEMTAAGNMLRQLFDTRLVFLPDGDPGQRCREELDWHRANNSRPAGETLSRLL